MTKERKITLNAEKRKVIADQFQSFYEDKVKDKLIQAKEQYDIMREKAKVAITKVVRFHQPQEDVDTIRSMIKKYNSAGGELYEDNCFYVQQPITKVDDQGKEYISQDEVHVRFDMGRNFARAYYRDEMKATIFCNSRNIFKFILQIICFLNIIFSIMSSNNFFCNFPSIIIYVNLICF